MEEGGAILNKVVREGSSGEVTFEQKYETDEGAAVWVYEGRAFIPGEGVVNSTCKGPEVGPCLAVLKYGRQTMGWSSVAMRKQ